MKNSNKNPQMLEEWFRKVFRGALGGLILSIVMTVTGAFKGDPFWMYILCYVSYMLYGIGFSFGTLITKLAWRKFVARGKSISIWMAVTGRGFGGLLIIIGLLLFGLTAGCVLGFIICIVDLVAALQGKRFLSAILEMRYGDRVYESADPGNIIETGVRFNYENHGTAYADKTDYTRGYTPNEQQVWKLTQEKKNELGYHD